MTYGVANGRPYVFNPETNRLITDEALAFGCYTGAIDGNEWVGTHHGALGDQEQAEQWLNGSDAVRPLTCYSDEARRLWIQRRREKQ